MSAERYIPASAVEEFISWLHCEEDETWLEAFAHAETKLRALLASAKELPATEDAGLREAAEKLLGVPSPDDVRVLIRVVGGTTESAEAMMRLCNVWEKQREALRAALARETGKP